MGRDVQPSRLHDEKQVYDGDDDDIRVDADDEGDDGSSDSESSSMDANEVVEEEDVFGPKGVCYRFLRQCMLRSW